MLSGPASERSTGIVPGNAGAACRARNIASTIDRTEGLRRLLNIRPHPPARSLAPALPVAMPSL